MSLAILPAALIGAATGWLVAGRLYRRIRTWAAHEVVRSNVNGREVPVSLGAPVVAGSVAALGLLAAAGAAGWDPVEGFRVPGAVAVAMIVMWLAGRWDDLRGDERPRGFGGHLGALGAGRLTGGTVKIAAGGAAGLAAGLILSGGGISGAVAVTAALVALSANLVNLFDRAPGRAAKVWLTGAVIVGAAGPAAWIAAASGPFGASLAVLPGDLGEEAMLGDAGANPLGAALGVGLAAWLEHPWSLVAAGVLLVVNLASERWSFSALIDRSRFLTSLDMAGRKH